ncbi:hypothetical protein [Thalassiella azotivora]
MSNWIYDRAPRTGRITAGEHVGAIVDINPEPADAKAWHIYIKGGPEDVRYDLWVDNETDLREWLADQKMPIQLDPE